MSMSKLESLPNEILIGIFEKYINGIDILNAFAFQLNRRFDALIAQCQGFRFDFMRCHIDDFRFCIGLLPVYMDKIEELALSEQNTPGQIHAFLSFFPSFDLFKRLRKLYFHINAEAVQPEIIGKALHLLAKTTLDTLSIKIIKVQNIFSLNNAIVEIFRMKTLKKFSIAGDSYRMNWASLSEVSSNIEYLTIYGMCCNFQDLKYIFQCASGLKYLNTQVLEVRFYNPNKQKAASENTITRMSMLHTVILNMEGHGQKIHTSLETYLRCMPSLHRLEIKIHNIIDDVSVWETLLKTSFPKLTYFNLEINAFNLQDIYVKNTLESIQTPFWIEKKNFNIIITEFEHLNNNWSSLVDLHNLTQHGSDTPVGRWWIGPRRKLNDNLSAMNKISRLSLSIESSSLLQDDYLDNVNQLVVLAFNDNLLELLARHVNCSQIKHLDISFLKQENDRISSLLRYIRNIVSLRITLNQLSNSQFAYLKECNGLKFLDISTEQHRFDKKNISIIADMFPNLEHLIINTQDLRNVPLLQTYLPSLRSLTFASIERNDSFGSDDYQQKMSDVYLRQTAQFLFQRTANQITVWIDQAALQESYWQITNNTSQRPSYDSMFNDPDTEFLRYFD